MNIEGNCLSLFLNLGFVLRYVESLQDMTAFCGNATKPLMAPQAHHYSGQNAQPAREVD
jgi:hypothetical protein